MIAYEHLSSISWATLAIGIWPCSFQIFGHAFLRKFGFSGLLSLWPQLSLLLKFISPVKTIGDLCNIKAGLPSFTAPDLSFSLIRQMISPAFTIAILAAVGSLLFLRGSDGMIGVVITALMQNWSARCWEYHVGPLWWDFCSRCYCPYRSQRQKWRTNIVAGMVHALPASDFLFLMPYASLIPMTVWPQSLWL